MDKDLFISHPVYTNYEVSRNGIVRHKRLKKNIGSIIKTGYIQVSISYNGKNKK